MATLSVEGVVARSLSAHALVEPTLSIAQAIVYEHTDVAQQLRT